MYSFFKISTVTTDSIALPNLKFASRSLWTNEMILFENDGHALIYLCNDLFICAHESILIHWFMYDICLCNDLNVPFRYFLQYITM